MGFLKFLFIVIVFLLLTVISIGGYFTYKQPDFVISLIRRVVPQKAAVPLTVKGIAVIGYSQSDEYRADDSRGDNYPTTTLNWVEILAQERKLNFGEWGIWEEPRRSGYAYNWARSGATAASLIESGQHIGVAEQVKKGEVNVVVVYIGANDFAPHITEDGYQAIYNEQLTYSQLQRKQNRIVADIQTAIEVIKNAGDVKIILVTIPDWSHHVGVKVAFPLPHKRILVTNAIGETNRKLEIMGSANGAVVLDSNQFYRDMVKDSPSAKPLIGDVQLEWLFLNNDPKNVFLNDGVHTGTAMNGLFTNYFLNVLNSQLIAPLAPLSNEEILKVAGLD